MPFPESTPLLALETSGREMSVALWGPSGLLAEQRARDGARHGTALAVLTQNVMKDANLVPSGLSAIAVSLGPGSWTGLRIGLAAGKALAWGSGIALVGVPSFEAMALAALRAVSSKKGKPAVLTVRNAYSEGFFLGLFRETEGNPQRLVKESVLRLEDIASCVREALVKDGVTETILCGETTCLEKLHTLASEEGWRVLNGFDEVPAAVLAERAWTRMRDGSIWRTAAEIHSVLPLYLRASDPELKLQRRGT
jgi:tRNA threonylcarbamoyl adenosine modification protein YeaZ